MVETNYGKNYETIIELAVTFLHYIVSPLESNPDSYVPRLAEMTAVFNPSRDGKFNENDWLKLTTESPWDIPGQGAINQIKRYWDKDYSRWSNEKLVWKIPVLESNGTGADYTAYNSQGIPVQYFWIVPFP